MSVREERVTIVTEGELGNVPLVKCIVETADPRETSACIFLRITIATFRIARINEHLVDVGRRVFTLRTYIFATVRSLLEYDHTRHVMLAEAVRIVQEPVELLAPQLLGLIFQVLVVV